MKILELTIQILAAVLASFWTNKHAALISFPMACTGFVYFKIFAHTTICVRVTPGLIKVSPDAKLTDMFTVMVHLFQNENN